MSDYKKDMDEYKKELYGIEEDGDIDELIEQYHKEEEIESKEEENNDTKEKKQKEKKKVEKKEKNSEEKEKKQTREEYRKEKETEEESVASEEVEEQEKEEKEEGTTNIEEKEETTEEVEEQEEVIEEDKKEEFDELREGYRREIEDIDNNFIVFKNVSKNYMTDNYSVQTLALDNISFDIKEGELVILLGHSGAGKTTTLNLLGGMDVVTSGRIIVGDKEISNYSLDQLTEYRKNDIGFIFQAYNLIQNLTVRENIDLATEIKNQRVDASIILEKVGLPDKLNVFPAQLSGGEQQRVAIARAMAKKPKILLCDEPTGSLDDATGKQILALIQKTCKEENVTTIIITHNHLLADMADRVIYFNSGKVTKIKENKNPKNVEDLEW